MVFNYEEVEWSEGDDITLEKMQRMAQNDAYFFSTLTSGRFVFTGEKSVDYTGQLKFYATNARLYADPATATNADGTKSKIRHLSGPVYWAGEFAPGPVLVFMTPTYRNVFPKDISMTATNLNYSGDGGNWPDEAGAWIHAALSAETTTEFQGGRYLGVHILAVGRPVSAE